MEKINKKGISDGILWVVLIFIIFIIIVTGFFVNNSLNTAIAASDLGNESKQMVSDFNSDYPAIFDGLMVTFFFGLLLASFLAAILIDTNPAVYFIGLILFMVILVIGAFLANAAINFSESSAIANYAAEFPMSLFILNNFVIILVVYIALFMVVIWGKTR